MFRFFCVTLAIIIPLYYDYKDTARHIHNPVANRLGSRRVAYQADQIQHRMDYGYHIAHCHVWIERTALHQQSQYRAIRV